MLMTYSTHKMVDIYKQPAVTVLQFEILASYMEEDTFKLAGGHIPKGIYQNPYCSHDFKKNFARWGSMLTATAYLYAL